MVNLGFTNVNTQKNVYALTVLFTQAHTYNIQHEYSEESFMPEETQACTSWLPFHQSGHLLLTTHAHTHYSKYTHWLTPSGTHAWTKRKQVHIDTHKLYITNILHSELQHTYPHTTHTFTHTHTHTYTHSLGLYSFWAAVVKWAWYYCSHSKSPRATRDLSVAKWLLTTTTLSACKPWGPHYL